MRKIDWTAQFKRDYKRESKGQHRHAITYDFPAIIETLASDQTLAEKYRDHVLIGRWKDCRDCHIKPNLVMVYRKIDQSILELIRLGSHSELGL